MTLEEQLAEQAKKGLLGLGFEQETAEEYAPWASMLAQFIPGVGEGVGVDNTVDAIQDERYGDAAIEGGLTLLGAVPVVGDMAAAAIKGIRRAPVKAFDEAAWLKENPRPYPEIAKKDMTPAQYREYMRHAHAKSRAKNLEKKRASDREQKRVLREDPEYLKADREKKANMYAGDPEYRSKRKQYEAEKYANDPEYRERALSRVKSRYQEVKDTPEVRARQRKQNAKRRSALLKRLPSWADPDRIEEIYKTAEEIARETGIPHHVDHVIPLQGKNVSGLHHQDNLLIVPGAENLSKGNRFEPGDLPPRAGVRRSRAYLKKIKAAQEAAKRK